MRIITTPMCEDVLKIAGLTNYEVVRPDNIKNADIAILLSETKSDVPKISIKLNTYMQIYESILTISEKFNSSVNYEKIELIQKLIKENSDKKFERQKISVKVYSNFLKETVSDMGFSLNDTDYDYVVCPDYLEDTVTGENLIIIPSHKNVSINIIDRINERYEYLERELCMKQ